MATHPDRQAAVQALWDEVGHGDYESWFDNLTDDIVVDNGPGAGPWRHTESKEAWLESAMQFVPVFGDTWRQVGTCVYADNEMSITIVHETGVTPDGDVFDNRAIWVGRLDADGRTNRIWTTDLAHEALEEFWQRNPVTPTTAATQ